MKIEIKKIETKEKHLDPSLIVDHQTVVLEAEDLYPGIHVWYDKKAKPGLESGERIGYLVTKNGIPVGAALAKHDENSKICTVRVRDEAIHDGIGKILFLLMAMNLRIGTKKVHFTAPENLWDKYSKFFEEMGFTNRGYFEDQYRLFDPEIFAEADYKYFSNFVFRNYLPLYAGLIANINGEKIDMILSLKPVYAERVINKTKIMELRKKFSSKWIGKWALIYSSSPIQAFVAKVKVKDVIQDTPESLWLKWHDAIDCRLEEFTAYTHGINIIYGIVLDDVQKIEPIPKWQLEHLLHRDLVPPQSYLGVENNPDWKSAVGMSHLMRGLNDLSL
ncbi:hypothetical protein CEE37_05140 [candidate division LCP-89 bacterium B3_LCP]|uniref:N-acetyltransferase domain-containing protein n=1 Tax=candidate division LCP-89 bacterium B3_LCP TaxID=2012998 RepID=A0A532V1P6_UNCL8|nr:MAG: hypothetical protein CEE37_05140 [candidate division LCP-89 bacterium B3_LCP]